MNSLKYFGLAITSAGTILPPDGSYEVLRHIDRNGYRKVVLKDRRMVGMLCAGDIERSGILLSLIREKTDVSDFKNKLVACEFNLASLPEHVWRPKLALQGVVLQTSRCKTGEAER